MIKQGIHKIQNLRRRWVLYQLLADAVLAAAIALVSGSLLICLTNAAIIWAVLLFAGVLSIMLTLHRPWLMSDEKIAGFLNRQYPELEESTDLLLRPTRELNVLQGIIISKIAGVLAALQVEHRLFAKRLLRSLLLLLFAVVFSFLANRLYKNKPAAAWFKNSSVSGRSTVPPEKILPQIDEVAISITPPAYTRKPQRRQDRFNLVAEDGAVISWHIKTNTAVANAFLLFNDKERIMLTGNGARTGWTAQKTITRPGFYQVSIGGKLSDLYQVQVIKDGPPVIHIRSPKQYTYIDAGENPQVNISTSLNDDYGIAGAVIMATVAKGRGEGVKFKEYKISFADDFNAHKPAYNVHKLIKLPVLNMEPGDELYFYVQANDTRRQQSRTDVYTVAIQDTAELLSMDGVLSGANLKPEFFRSERQIIIDAEKLIKDKDTISIEKFNNRSNDLAIDQKLLRLRYGKFLGEEDEAGEGSGGGNDELSSPENFSNGTKILKQYTDDHDKAEDAQFFEPAIKAQLKATLNEMWKAELQLRLYKPAAALPFAYKALRLLKDLQQKSRSYVAKTAYNPPPIKPEKRLTGELDKIMQPVNRQEIKPGTDPLDALRKAVNVLEQLKLRPVLYNEGKRTLQTASQQLSTRASAQPGSYLPALNAMRRILSAQKINRKDIDMVERSVQRTLEPLKVMPGSVEGAADMGLSRRYFTNLKQNNR